MFKEYLVFVLILILVLRCRCQGKFCTCSETNQAGTTSGSGNTSTLPYPPVVDIRLPTTLQPLLYTLELQPNMYTLNPDEFTFNGSLRILVFCTENTSNITLHMKELNLTGPISVMQENIVRELYSYHEFDTVREFIIIRTGERLIAGSRYTVEFTSFSGPIRVDFTGLYLSTYERGGKTVYLTVSQLFPTEARKVFPCFDEPGIKAEFKVTLLRQGHMTALSTMPIATSVNRTNGWIADTFQTTPRMSTCVLVFVVCDLTTIIASSPSGVQYRAWSSRDAIQQTLYALDTGVKVLDYMEKFLNVLYPLPKLDVLAISEFVAEAMSNWGLIVYQESVMLYEPGESSERNKQSVATVMSHELSHQWFGHLVTPNWGDDLWLNEGLSTYVEYLGVDHVYPEWKMFEQFVVEKVHDGFDMDGLMASHPLYVPIAQPSEFSENFDTITYSKGGSILRMIRFFLGDSTFQNGLTRYLNTFRYGVASSDDLWFALGNQSIIENNPITYVKDIMDTWTLQMNYPVVTVKHDGKRRITLTQRRYLQNPNATDPGTHKSPFGYKWYIPFAFTTSDTRRFDVNSSDVIMMTPYEITKRITHLSIPAPVGNNWIIGNPMQYGFYRVNYDVRNWNALIRQLKVNHSAIHPINRAQLINDAWSLASSDDLRMLIALGTIEYIDKERDYVPWTAANRQIIFVKSMLERNPLYGAFQKFIQSKVLTAFNELTMNNTGATHLESFLQSTIVGLACDFGIKSCVDQAKMLFSEWMLTPDNNPIEPELRPVVYCTAIAEGGINEWEFALSQYKATNVASEKSRLLIALACTQQTWILSRYLEMALDANQIRLQDSALVIENVASNTIGRSLAWDFFRSQWDFLFSVFGRSPFAFARLISGVTSSFNTDLDLEQLQIFVDSKPDLGTGARAFAQALERTQININWMSTNVQKIKIWLQKQGF